RAVRGSEIAGGAAATSGPASLGLSRSARIASRAAACGGAARSGGRGGGGGTRGGGGYRLKRVCAPGPGRGVSSRAGVSDAVAWSEGAGRFEASSGCAGRDRLRLAGRSPGLAPALSAVVVPRAPHRQPRQTDRNSATECGFLGSRREAPL